MTTTYTAIDIPGLVDAGLIDLDVIFAGADWSDQGVICEYVACCFGAAGVSPGEVDVRLETATAYGITAWRWHESEAGESGEIMLAEQAAVDAAQEHAEDSDESPDIDDTIAGILESGYFGAAATAADVRGVCGELCSHSQGYLLLPRGEVPAAPVGRMWTTNGYLQCDYISVDATHGSIELAAAALLEAVTA